jgi:hypothetical protein
MKFVALLLLPIAASSGSSASARDGPQDQVQVTQAVGQQTGARSLRGRQKRRPCAKSIATYCNTAKNAAAKQACLRAKLGTNSLDPRCEALVAGRAAALKACRPVAAAIGCAQGPVPIACMQHGSAPTSTFYASTPSPELTPDSTQAPLPQGRRRHAPGGHGVRPSSRPPRGPQGREPGV